MINQQSNPAAGYVSMFFCCLTSAISFVFIAHLNKTHNQMLSIFITFGYAVILFNLFNIKKIRNLYSSVFRNLKLLFYMNIMTLFNWISSFLALSYIDPATAVCIDLCVISIVLFFMLTPLKKIKENKHLALSVMFILLSMALIVKQYVSISSDANMKAIMLGVFWSVVSGVSGAFIGLCSEGMGNAGFSVTQILSTRFYLLIATSGILFFLLPDAAPLNIDWSYYLLSSLVIVIFPLVMYQTAVKKLGVLIVSLLEPFTPVMTYFLQISIGDYRFNLLTILLLVMSSGAVIWFVRIEQSTARMRNIVEKEQVILDAAS